MGGGGGGDGGAAEDARRREQERQARISSGMSRIDAIFGGGQYGTGRIDRDAYDPNGSYFNADGSKFSAPMSEQKYQTGTRTEDVGDNGSREVPVYGMRRAVDQGALDSMFANGGLFSDVSSTGGFDDNFYDERSQSYVDFAAPQLQDQYKDASAALTAALSRSGQLSSSLAGDRGKKLQKDFATQRQSIADRGREYASSARRTINDSRSEAVSMLNASADPDAAVSQALNSASAARDAVPAFDPLGAVFQNATAGLGGYMQGQRMGEISNRVKDIYGRDPSRGSGTTVR